MPEHGGTQDPDIKPTQDGGDGQRGTQERHRNPQQQPEDTARDPRFDHELTRRGELDHV